ncbi:MAG: AEC family transporter [Desulfobacterales bacterium]|jgi:malonate transporter
MVLNNLFPVFALLLFGHLLKRVGFTHDAFLKTADKLIYFIFFPALLFWKIGAAASGQVADPGLYKAVICAVISIYVFSSLYIKVFNVPAYQAGSFSQSCYRFNTYIGMAVVLNALGEDGARQFSILIGLIIPIINILAVSTLSWYSGEKVSLLQRVRLTAKALISNPLIIACLSGIVYSKLIGGFPIFIDNTFRLAAFVTLPLALFSIGGALTLGGMKNHLKLSLAACVFKLILLPITGFLFLKLFNATGISFKVGMIYFALPTSTALYILSAQLSSDTQLASAAIALSTILSFISLSVALLI